MNQRKSPSFSTTQIVAAIVVGLVVVVGGGFGIYKLVHKDASKSTTSPGTSKTIKPGKLSVATIPFSFEYPGNFALAANPPGLLWIAGISPSDIIDVRRIAQQEYSVQKTIQVARKALDKQAPGLKILGQDQAAAGGKPLVRFVVNSSPGGKALQSQLIFFSTAGAAWQIECQSQASGRAFINAACIRMLQTLTFK